jgi:phosphohistidine swiveling domain-containing protein
MAERQYVRGYEVFGVSPLPHYFEEIYGHTKGISAIGPRGDDYYFWYCKDGKGAAYYEKGEQVKSAKSTLDFFNRPQNQKKYFNGIKRTVSEIQALIRRVEVLDVKGLSTEQLFEYSYQSWMLDAKIFSYYLISQPYRLQLLENQVRQELKKRVAGSRIDSYLAKLTASELMTQTANEELEWAKLIIKAKSRVGRLNRSDLDVYSDLKQSLLKHYEKYKILGLGDGNWVFNPEAELERFVADFKRPVSEFEQKATQIKNHPKEVLAERKKLAKDLYLSKETLKTIELLAALSHVRYSMRVEGFMPLIYAVIQVFDELAVRLGLDAESDYLLPYMTFEEFAASKAQGSAVVPRTELRRRRGKHGEYMLMLNKGKVAYLYGRAAGSMFKKLVPPVNHHELVEINGVSAEQGHVNGTVTVYQWGDDMDAAIHSIKKHQILVAGQTRPAMMPIIRMAKGIVTDEGGVTSHAAIVARELRIPTVINTGNATNVFKTGDKIELDATGGIVRKLS